MLLRSERDSKELSGEELFGVAGGGYGIIKSCVRRKLKLAEKQ